MTELEIFVEKMQEKYGEVTIIKTGSLSEKELLQVPWPLKELYRMYGSIEFPFGYIDPLKSAIEFSNKAFRDEGWFCFGFDGYFSYWLCRYEPDAEGLWFTSWDHEGDDELECVDASAAGIVDFLTDMENEYDAERRG